MNRGGTVTVAVPRLYGHVGCKTLALRIVGASCANSVCLAVTFADLTSRLRIEVFLRPWVTLARSFNKSIALDAIICSSRHKLRMSTYQVCEDNRDSRPH